MWTNVWFLVGLAIILPLMGYTIGLYWRLYKQHQQIKQIQSKHIQHDEEVINSVKTIAEALDAEQCEYSEGCYRICVLLQSLKFYQFDETLTPNIFTFYEQVSQLAILDERKALPKQQRMKEDLQRFKLEAKYLDQLKQELPHVLKFCQQKLAI
jgi:hypothetical protein